eukprot:scaffold41448_cov199-Amphora_coffeaeformis.AAC.3
MRSRFLWTGSVWVLATAAAFQPYDRRVGRSGLLIGGNRQQYRDGLVSTQTTHTMAAHTLLRASPTPSLSNSNKNQEEDNTIVVDPDRVRRRQLVLSMLAAATASSTKSSHAAEATTTTTESTTTTDQKLLRPQVIRPPLDDRVYRTFTLPSNGLRVLVCSDPSTNEAAVAMDVHVGATSDPKDVRGLAHFTEHMLFCKFNQTSTLPFYEGISLTHPFLNLFHSGDQKGKIMIITR